MPLRVNILPRAFPDVFPFSFLICIIPIIYWFEIWVVLPELYPPETSTQTYTTLFVLAHFFLFNVVGNYIGILVSDTSVRGRVMPSIDSPDAAGYCDDCKTVTPSRSYHCPTCKVCILRRDHHCLFAACCIGQFNYRYFLMFLLHMFLSTAICLPFNIRFLWNDLYFTNFMGILQIIFPLIIIFRGSSFNRIQCYVALFVISILGMLLILTWFYFHMRLAMRGKVVHEMRRNINMYDLGFVDNLKEVMGERWYLVWLSPFINSKLTCNGVNFKTKEHSQ